MINDTDKKTVAEKDTEKNTEKDTEKVVGDDAKAVVPAPVPASLTVQDLANLRNIIDIASQRGAFKASEFSAVGAIYTKLNDFVKAIAPAKEVVEEKEKKEDDKE